MNNRKIGFIFISTILSLITILILLFLIITNDNSEIAKMFLYCIAFILITISFIYKERKDIINVKTIFVGLYIIMIGISPLIYYFINKTFILPSNINLEKQFLYIILGYIFLIIGMYIFKFKPKAIEFNKIKKDYVYEKYFSLLLLLPSLLVNVYVVIANFSAYFGGNLVEDTMNMFASKGILVAINSLHLLGIGLLFNYCYHTNRLKKTLAFFIIVNTILFTIRGNRTQVLMIFIYLFLLRNHFKKFSIKRVLSILILFLLGIGILGSIRDIASSNNSSAMNNLFNNLQVNSINLGYVMKTFPTRTDYQKGKTLLLNIIMLRPGADDDFTLWLKKQIGLSYSGGGLTPTLVGEGYINFGLIGVILFCFFAGYIASILNYYYLNRQYDAIWSTYVIAKLTDIFRGGFANTEVSLIICLAVFLGYKILYIFVKKNDNIAAKMEIAYEK